MQRSIPLMGLLVVLLAVNVWGQSSLTVPVGLGYKVIISEDPAVPYETRAIMEMGLDYLVPVASSGEHNLKVGAISGVGTDYREAGFKLGYAYAPRRQPQIIVGLTGIFDITWAEDELQMLMIGDDVRTGNAWLGGGIEGSLDFKIPGGLPGKVLAGYVVGIQGAPSQFYFALNLPMQPNGPEETVKRFDKPEDMQDADL